MLRCWQLQKAGAGLSKGKGSSPGNIIQSLLPDISGCRVQAASKGKQARSLIYPITALLGQQAGGLRQHGAGRMPLGWAGNAVMHRQIHRFSSGAFPRSH